jgi:hypothetical protein
LCIVLRTQDKCCKIGAALEIVEQPQPGGRTVLFHELLADACTKISLGGLSKYFEEADTTHPSIPASASDTNYLRIRLESKRIGRCSLERVLPSLRTSRWRMSLDISGIRFLLLVLKGSFALDLVLQFH